MIILTLRTDKPEAEIGLYDDYTRQAYLSYEAHRILAETLHQKIEDLLKQQSLSWQDIEGLVCYKGPGSFTGLRIGLSLANALSDGQRIPIIGSNGDAWIESGVSKIVAGSNDKLVVPEYGAEPHITIQKK
jgi:tRNA threonylcarbamoyladenosine biosynthesis protein TsaB